MKKAIYLMLAIILVANAMAIGIAPGSLETAGDSTETFFIVNNEHRDMRVLVYAEGGMADNVLVPNIIEVKAGEETKKFTVKIDDISAEDPGSHEVKLIAVELPSDDESSGTVISTRQAVASKIELQVPYPGKFAEAELDIPKKESGEPLDFVVKVRNQGGQDIAEAQARIDIFSPTNEQIASLMTDSKGISAGEMRELVAKYHTPLNKGRYYAKAVVTYDGQEVVAEAQFEVGDLMIGIDNIYVKEFRLGEIAKFDIIVESKWNDLIPDVFADMEVRDQYGNVAGRFKTSEVDVDAYSKEFIEAYWDTKEANVGRYNAKITLHFLGNNIEKTVGLNVREDGIDIDFMPTAQVVSAAPTENQSFIIILVILSIFINIGLFVWFARRKK